MIKKLIILFKLGRKVAKSDILNIISKFQEPPLSIRFIFKILSFSFSKESQINRIEDEGERLSNSLESMGTTFADIQFLQLDQYNWRRTSKKPENLQINSSFTNSSKRNY